MAEIDREKVIKGLYAHGYRDCKSCPYWGSGENGNSICTQLTREALALLEEQKAKKGHWIVLDFCANEGIYCSECHMKIFDRTTKPKKKLSQYCPHCGSRNDRFFRDGEVIT